MNELQMKLNGLDDVQEAYVWERSVNNGAIQNVLKNIGVSKAKFYTDNDETKREELDEIARMIRRDTAMRAQRDISDHIVEAVGALVTLMRSAKSEHVRYQSAMGILAYGLGTPRQQIDVTSNGESVKLYAEVSPDDWDE